MTARRASVETSEVAIDPPASPSKTEAHSSEAFALLSQELPTLSAELFINRELSWLDFNARVLAEARDPLVPLLERAKFIAIFSSNLDEFFMIRVAGVLGKINAGITEPSVDGRTPTALYLAIRERTRRLQYEQTSILQKELLPELQRNGIVIGKVDELSEQEQAALGDYFRQEVFPVLTPQAIDHARRFPHISNDSISLIVLLRSIGEDKLARIKLPKVLPRLVRVPAQGDDEIIRFVWLEDLISAHLHELFPGHQAIEAYPFHLTRDSDIEIDDDEDAHDLLATMRELLSERTFGSVVRLMVDTRMPQSVVSWLLAQLGASERELYVADGPLALEDLMELLRIDRPDLKDPPLTPSTFARNPDEGAWGVPDIFAVIRKRDVLVHHPFQSFSIFTDFLKAASTDRDVVAIKQTLYRIGKDSPLVPALIEARDDDTQVAVLVELKARFDEENNISWAQQLEHHGVHVAYGISGLKTHCKVTLVVRREADGLRRYVHLSTGNYNAGTARLYEDLGLFTSDAEITSDISELFNVLTGYSEQEQYRKIWVAPGSLRGHFLRGIAREIAAHREHGNGRLIFKMNSLVDRELIRALYAASRAGVQIDLIIRGACCLRPGVPEWSENIRVRSVIGRFLEHSRIYYFGNGGNDEIYIGSADLMERNLDRRIEVVFPVEDRSLVAYLRDTILPLYLSDIEDSWTLDREGRWTMLRTYGVESQHDVQAELMQLYARPGISVPNFSTVIHTQESRMDFSLALQGLLIGLAVAAPVGPMSLLTMRRTLDRGLSAGLVFGSRDRLRRRQLRRYRSVRSDIPVGRADRPSAAHSDRRWNSFAAYRLAHPALGASTCCGPTGNRAKTRTRANLGNDVSADPFESNRRSSHLPLFLVVSVSHWVQPSRFSALGGQRLSRFIVWWLALCAVLNRIRSRLPAQWIIRIDIAAGVVVLAMALASIVAGLR